MKEDTFNLEGSTVSAPSAQELLEGSHAATSTENPTASQVPSPAHLGTFALPHPVVVFTGHRDAIVHSHELYKIKTRWCDAVWVHGGAEGFDTTVEEFALYHEMDTFIYRPEYDVYPAKQAPLRRNDAMLELLRDHMNAGGTGLVVAAWDGRVTGGTYYTVTKARKWGLPVEIIPLIGVTANLGAPEGVALSEGNEAHENSQSVTTTEASADLGQTEGEPK